MLKGGLCIIKAVFRNKKKQVMTCQWEDSQKRLFIWNLDIGHKSKQFSVSFEQWVGSMILIKVLIWIKFSSRNIKKDLVMIYLTLVDSEMSHYSIFLLWQCTQLEFHTLGQRDVPLDQQPIGNTVTLNCQIILFLYSLLLTYFPLNNDAIKIFTLDQTHGMLCLF